ncbi:hypothetical protein HOP50_02g16970 [Chloropicon primus]|uniref:Uncharacterized protein n=1 Tax=Chloropicon primus TaxID=1764295 RepID=A0A5B8MFE2_9CHLO|nr:hypothetical protein A3770_02p17010 [Chloropicon primus]UPQ98391.1 hypothetical protein HOP50_02g16970 [Chloropicon primus]|eukprot:QDZ19183.1 hypothetical protein A3770_02p17010 [Chloropicon primus]
MDPPVEPRASAFQFVHREDILEQLKKNQELLKQIEVSAKEFLDGEKRVLELLMQRTDILERVRENMKSRLQAVQSLFDVLTQIDLDKVEQVLNEQKEELLQQRTLPFPFQAS